MDIPMMTEKDLVDRINKLKPGKAAGTDGVKGEVFKHMIKNLKIRKMLLMAMNGIWKNKRIPIRWTQSTTSMIQKSAKPLMKDFRPIAVTCLGAKLVYVEPKLWESIWIHERWTYRI